LLRSQKAEEIVIANKFFERKTSTTIYEDLLRLVDDMDEPSDLRLQAIIHLRKNYNIEPKTIKYLTEEELEFIESNDHVTEKERTLALPSGLNNEVINSTNGLKIPIALKNSKLLVDSLPYIDTTTEVSVREEMNKLLEMELNNIQMENNNRDYLEDFPIADLKFLSNPIIEEELKRRASNLTLNEIRGEIKTKFSEPAPNKFRNEKNWKELIKQLNISTQHLNLKNCNLELLIKYGPNAWKKYLSNIEQISKQYDKEIANLTKANQEVNTQRKYTQNEAKEKLMDVDSALKFQLNHNAELKKECLRLKYKIKKFMRVRNKIRIRTEHKKPNTKIVKNGKNVKAAK